MSAGIFPEVFRTAADGEPLQEITGWMNRNRRQTDLDNRHPPRQALLTSPISDNRVSRSIRLKTNEHPRGIGFRRTSPSGDCSCANSVTKKKERHHIKCPEKKHTIRCWRKSLRITTGKIQTMPKITLMFMNPEESRSREADRREPSTARHLRY